MHPNIKAFLDTIATSEGTYGKGDNGYNVLVGGALFHNGYATHPNILVPLPRLGIQSTAAGRYQILYRYYVAYKKLLKLPDFSPASQDAIAVQMIREQKAYDDVIAGRFTLAIDKCKNIWASLPGAGYGQHEQQMATLLKAFTKSGGVLT